MANSEILNLFEKEDALIKEQRPTNKESFDNTLAFLSELTFPIGSKGHIPPTNQKHIESDQRRFEITSRYASEYMKGGEDAAQRFGLTRERVRQVVTETLHKLWASAPASLQEKYPLATLSTSKSLSIRRGSRAEIVAAFKKGENINELLRRFGANTISYQRRVLKRLDVEIPLAEDIVDRFGKLNSESTDDEVLRLLDEVKSNQTYGALIKVGFITNLTRVTRRAGLYPDVSDIASLYNKLKAEGLPTGRIPLKYKIKGEERISYYNFIATIDLEEAVRILRYAPEFAGLKENPVERIAGPKGPLPNTTELYSDKYASVDKLITSIRGVRLPRRSEVRIRGFIDGSPVPIYRTVTQAHYRYLKVQEQKLRAFLEVRLKELGLN